MTDLVKNLLGALEVEQEGPDPTRLSGLLELAGQALEGEEPISDSLIGFFGQMRQRLQELHRDRQGALEGRRSELSPGLVEVLERNLATCTQVDAALEAFLEAARTGSREAGWGALESLETTSYDFRDSCEALAALAQSPQPLCPRCGSSGPEGTCPGCGLDRLVPDPEVGQEEFAQAAVPGEFMAVYTAYCGVVDGRTGLAPLVNALQPLEFSLLEAQALAEQALEQAPEDKAAQELVEVVGRALEAIQRMLGARDTRLTRDLHQGWVELFRCALSLTRLVPGLGGAA